MADETACKVGTLGTTSSGSQQNRNLLLPTFPCFFNATRLRSTQPPRHVCVCVPHSRSSPRSEAGSLIYTGRVKENALVAPAAEVQRAATSYKVVKWKLTHGSS